MREDAGSDIVVSKEVVRDGKPARITQTIPVRKLIDNADPSAQRDAAWRRGSSGSRGAQDLRGGQRQETGSVPDKNDEETTILQLLALSEGLTPYSAKVAYVYRRSPGGAKTEVPVPWRRS
jgi:hypothetical protein